MTSPHTASRVATPSSVGAASELSLTIHLYRGYQQIVDFHLPGVTILGLDEGPPLGKAWGPSPAHLLASAVGSCLAGALLRVLHDAGATVIDLRTTVRATVRSDTLGQPHVTSLDVRLTPVVGSRADLASLPSPERLARLSMVADTLRPDLAFWIAINPEVRTEAEPVRQIAPARRLGLETAAPAPHFCEPSIPAHVARSLSP